MSGGAFDSWQIARRGEEKDGKLLSLSLDLLDPIQIFE
jgi:hypothetical protein